MMMANTPSGSSPENHNTAIRPDYLRADDLMIKFNVSRATVDRLPIKSVKVGGCRRWPVEWVERYENRIKRRA